MLTRIILFLISYLIFVGCNPWQNRLDRIAVECGIPKNTIGKSQIIKVVSSENRQFTEADIKGLRSVFRTSQEEASTLSFSNAGCLVLPESAGILQVIDSRTSESLTETMNEQVDRPTLREFRLLPKQNLQISLSCPSEGLFADGALTQPLAINFLEDPQGLDLRLDLFSQNDTLVKSLFRKTLGDKSLRFPETLKTENFPEGAYFLKVFGNHLSEGIETKPKLLLAEKPCRLYILHGKVKVGGLDETATRSVFPPNTLLPWTSQTPFEKLFFCEEPRAPAGNSPVETTKSCDTNSKCSNLKNFSEVANISTKEKGVFDYFVFSENKVGARSEISCQTIIVSDKAPTIQINWLNDALQTPGAVLKKIPAVLKAEISLFHEHISQKNIADNLLCKVDFELGNKNIFADRGVKCTDGVCKNQSLADFIPCGKTLNFSIVDALDKSILLNSRLRLTVRSSDGAGHYFESQISTWINQTIWTKEILDFQVNGESLSNNWYTFDQSGIIVASFISWTSRVVYLAEYKNSEWTQLRSLQGGLENNFKYAIANDRTLRIAEIKDNGSQGFTTQIFDYRDAKLTAIESSSDSQYMWPCRTFLLDSQNSPWCMSSPNEVYNFIDKKWQRLPNASSSDLGNGITTEWKILSNDTIAGLFENKLYIWDKSQWSIVELISPEAEITLNFLVEDFKGRTWIVGTHNTQNNHELYRIENNRLIPYPSIERFSNSWNSTKISHNKLLTELVFGFQKFDFGRDQWESIDFPSQLILSRGSLYTTHSDPDSTFVTNGDRGILELGVESKYWPLKGLGSPCVNGCGNIQRSNGFIYFHDFNNSKKESRIARLRATNVSRFDSSMIGEELQTASGSWLDPEGNLSIAHFNGTIVTFGSDSISTVAIPLLAEPGITSKLTRDLLCSIKYSGTYIFDLSTQTEKKISVSGYGNSSNCFMDRKGNILWSQWSENEVKVYDGVSVTTLGSVKIEVDEKILGMTPIFNGTNLMVYTAKRLILLSDNYEFLKEYTFNSIDPDLSQESTLFCGQISDHQLLVQVTSPTSETSYYEFDIADKKFAKSEQLKALISANKLTRIAFIGNRSFAITTNRSAFLIERYQGKWRSLATLGDIQRNLAVKQNPYFFAPDSYGRAWVLSRNPNTYLRVDSDGSPD